MIRPGDAIQLIPVFRERVWGREKLDPYFQNDSVNKRIGEVWFTCEENLTSLGISLGELLQTFPQVLGAAADSDHPSQCPLLLKVLFTSERLSVQVHPDDMYAAQHHGCRGKTEAWYVLAAEPGADVAVGFREPLAPSRLEGVARSGEIEQLLDWRDVHEGQTIFTPAGTIHAIGAGVTICEIQQNSDITYRLYDYGRPRELHLEHGARVADLGPLDCHPETVRLSSWREQLLECEYFRLERLKPERSFRVQQGSPGYLLLFCLHGRGEINDKPFKAGQTWMIPADNEQIEVVARDSEWILTYRARSPLSGLDAG
jgi:mannose-6-phosphate isomerase